MIEGETRGTGALQESAEIYDELIRRIEERSSPLAAQIREEIARGRLVQGSKLPEGERDKRQARLSESKLGRLGKDEMAVLPYTGDERLALLCEALLTLAETMAESRRALLELTTEHDLAHSRVEFIDPDEAEAAEFDLEDEHSRAARGLAEVKRLLEPAREEVGTWR
ncbi:hypothetical protein ACQPZJ_33095 [Actinoplanes sp. CA-054009]